MASPPGLVATDRCSVWSAPDVRYEALYSAWSGLPERIAAVRQKLWLSGRLSPCCVELHPGTGGPPRREGGTGFGTGGSTGSLNWAALGGEGLRSW